MNVAGQIVLAVLLAYGLSFFQYLYRSPKYRWGRWLFLLRGATYFIIFLLLLNPRIRKTSYSETRPNLVIAFDNSLSVKELDGSDLSLSLLKYFRESANLRERFDLHLTSFGSGWQPLDTLDFQGQDSRMDKMLDGLDRMYSDRPSAWITITDGNQSEGKDYEFFSPPESTRIFAVSVGDTVRYEDLKIDYLDANRFAFLGNNYPVKISLSYSGNRQVSSRLTVSINGSRRSSRVVEFTPERNSVIIEERFRTDRPGIQDIRAVLSGPEGEKNTINNQRRKRVEVIDERKRIAVVSELTHPDLSVLVKIIESNKQREARIISPSEALNQYADWDAFVLYQPGSTFNRLLTRITQERKGYLLIAGLSTDWNSVNRFQDVIRKEDFGPKESFDALPGESWSAFNRDSLNIREYPGLDDYLGSYRVDSDVRVLLQQETRRVRTGYPLLFLTDKDSYNRGFLIGEGLWKWRAQCYRNQRSFDAFDRTFSRLIRFISESRQRNRLQAELPEQIREKSNIEVRAVFFNPSFELDPTADLRIRVQQVGGTFTQVYPFNFTGSEYTTRLGELAVGNYRYRIYAEGEEISQSGSFTVESYTPELLWTRANPEKLNRFTSKGGGRVFFADQIDSLERALLSDPALSVLRTRQVERKPLIDFILLLFILSGTLTAEWFIRKFNGLF